MKRAVQHPLRFSTPRKSRRFESLLSHFPAFCVFPDDQSKTDTNPDSSSPLARTDDPTAQTDLNSSFSSPLLYEGRRIQHNPHRLDFVRESWISICFFRGLLFYTALFVGSPHSQLLIFHHQLSAGDHGIDRQIVVQQHNIRIQSFLQPPLAA